MLPAKTHENYRILDYPNVFFLNIIIMYADNESLIVMF